MGVDMSGAVVQHRIEMPIDFRMEKAGRHWKIFLNGKYLGKSTSKKAAQAYQKFVHYALPPLAECFSEALENHYMELEREG